MRQMCSPSLLAFMLALGGFVLRAPSASAQAWTQIAPTITPASRAGAVLVHDPLHKQLVLFGGETTDDNDETWTLEGDVWTQRAPVHSPPARHDAYGFWDSARQRVVLLAGNAAGQIDRDTIWSWDGDDWTSMTPTERPPARRDAAVAYDSTRDRIVLFGGVVDGSPDTTLADTWEFDGTRWSPVTPSTSPGDRGAALMGYDPVRKITVLVNGYSEATRALRRDTWTYDGISWNEVPNANPPQGSSMKLIWHPTQQKLLLAGRKETGKLTAWTFDGAVWSELPNASFDLNGIDEASMAFDAEGGYLLYLRNEGQSYTGFRLRDGSWDRLLPVPQPGGAIANRGTLLYDSQAGEARLLAEVSAGDGLQAWRWDGIMWRQSQASGAQRPSSSACVAYDAERGLSVAYDGRLFELDGDTWKARSSSSLPPSSGALAFDAGRKLSVYFGGVIMFGVYSDATWSWDGSSWKELEVLSPPSGRTRAGLAYDERRGRLVLFGGAEMMNGRQRHVFDTWELRGSTWTEVTTAAPIDLRDMPTMAYDRGRQRVVLWGRQDAEDAKLWEYDGRGWVGTEPPPIAGTSAIIGYDDGNKRLLLHDDQGRTWARPSGSAAPDNPSTPGSDEPSTSADAGSAAGGSSASSGGDGDEEGADGGVDGSDGDTPHRRGDSGCAVTTSAAPGSAGLAALLATLALLWRRSRRSSRRASG